MKKDLIFTPILVLAFVLLFLCDVIGMAAHISVAIIAALALAVYTSATKKEWKLPALEIGMRACYSVALISGIVIMNAHVALLGVLHKVSAVLFFVGIIALLATKLADNKKA